MMYDNDPYSRWMGMDIVRIAPGFCSLKMRLRDEMLNGFSVAHGSITYALADSALAFASNSHGRKCLSIDTQISHLKAVRKGDDLVAETEEINRSRNLARYNVHVSNQDGELVAHFQGTVYIKNEDWLDSNE